MQDILKEEQQYKDLPGVDPNNPTTYIARHKAVVDRMNETSRTSLRLLDEFLRTQRKMKFKSSTAGVKLKSILNKASNNKLGSENSFLSPLNCYFNR